MEENSIKTEKMLEAASKKLGITPEQLKAALQKGDLAAALGNMPKNDADKLKTLLNNPSAAQKLMKSPQAAELLKRFTKK